MRKNSSRMLLPKHVHIVATRPCTPCMHLLRFHAYMAIQVPVHVPVEVIKQDTATAPALLGYALYASP